MSIQDDIEALERVLADPLRNYSTWCGYKDACSPDRIRRLLDALKEAERRPGDIAAIGLALNASSEAKLSKAIELLIFARACIPEGVQQIEWIDDFLKEAGHE